MLFTTATLSVFMGLPAAAAPIATADLALEAAVIAPEDRPATLASFWPRGQVSPEKTTVIKQSPDISVMPHAATGLALEDMAFSGEPLNEAHRIQADELAAAPSQITALSTEAKDLNWEASDGAALTVNRLPLSEGEGAIAQAAEEAESEASSNYNLTAASQNPIANLISLPFQNNTTFGVGPFERTQNVLNIQPVYPVLLSEDLLLVTRTIVPVVLQPDINGGNHIWGLGDINPSFFFVPLRNSNVTWGVGPTLLLPTATDTQTGTGKWGVGPAGVVVVNSPPWVFGGLLSQVWSFAGDSDRADVSVLTAQPFVNYNLPNGWYLTSAPLINVNWNASGEKMTLPIGGGFGRVFTIGSQPVNASAQVYWNAIAPEGAGDITLRFSLSLLFPR